MAWASTTCSVHGPLGPLRTSLREVCGKHDNDYGRGTTEKRRSGANDTSSRCSRQVAQGDSGSSEGDERGRSTKPSGLALVPCIHAACAPARNTCPREDRGVNLHRRRCLQVCQGWFLARGGLAERGSSRTTRRERSVMAFDPVRLDVNRWRSRHGLSWSHSASCLS